MVGPSMNVGQNKFAPLGMDNLGKLKNKMFFK
jgi:hypothetical protein